MSHTAAEIREAWSPYCDGASDATVLDPATHLGILATFVAAEGHTSHRISLDIIRDALTELARAQSELLWRDVHGDPPPADLADKCIAAIAQAHLDGAE